MELEFVILSFSKNTVSKLKKAALQSLKVPDWPISFGSDEKSGQRLIRVLKINPDGIGPNYFYAEYLRNNSEYNSPADTTSCCPPFDKQE